MEKETYIQKIPKSSVTGLAVTKEFADAHPAETFIDSVEMPTRRKLRSTRTICEQLTKLASGLLYPSESNRPMFVFRWYLPDIEDAPTDISFELLSEINPFEQGENYFTESAAEFFERLQSMEIEEATKQRFRELGEFLKTNLNHLIIYHVGTIQVQIFIVGIAVDGNVIGCKTISIES